MDLSSMLEREDFFQSFFLTVKKYYKEVYGKDVEIDFADKKDCNLVIKPFLSAATSHRMTKKVRRFFYSEWNVRNSYIKYIVAKLGVFFLTHSGKMFSQFRFKILPEELATKDLVIAPNNRSIRFFDYSTETVGCVIKDGFTRKYFSNQLEFRKAYHYPFMVPLLNYGEDWFVEPILYGHPLARVTDKALYQKGLSDSLDNIAKLAKDTISFVNAEDYLKGVLASISEMLEQARERKNIKTYDQARIIVERAYERAKNVFDSIPLCMSHGDLQGGNIWIDDNGECLIYDWETAEKRSVWYDSSVLSYSLRREYGWKQLWSMKSPGNMTNCDPDKTRSFDEYTAMKCVVLLEDIIFYLEDMLELPNDWGNKIFDNYISRIYELDFQ